MDLAAAIEEHGKRWMNYNDHLKWHHANAIGKTCYKKNGYKVFGERPLRQVDLEYAVGDITQLFSLHDHLKPRLHHWKLQPRARRTVQRDSKAPGE